MGTMKKTVKMCDMDAYIAAKVFAYLNDGMVKLENDFDDICIVTDVDMDELTYPEGWYFADGTFRNKHNSSTGRYEELRVYRSSGGRVRY